MFALLARPLPIPLLAAGSVAICAAIAVYCLIYSALAGRPESLGEAFAWAGINVLPWLIAFEAAKRRRDLALMTIILAAAFASSLFLGQVASGTESLGFETARRLPALIVTGALLMLVSFAGEHESKPCAAVADWPLPPDQIDWVSAAGNYVEIKGSGRTLVHRASLGAAERALLGHGFVRIHRSTLVRRGSIARIRPADVVLRDGTSLKTGKRYRSSLLD